MSHARNKTEVQKNKIYVLMSHQARELCSYVLKRKAVNGYLQFFQKVSHARNETEAQQVSEEQNLCSYVPPCGWVMSLCLNKCGADPRSPIPVPRKNAPSV